MSSRTAKDRVSVLGLIGAFGSFPAVVGRSAAEEGCDAFGAVGGGLQYDAEVGF